MDIMGATAADLRRVVDHYKRKFRSRAQRELDSFAAETSLEAAVVRAGLVEKPDGSRYSHQRRRSPDELHRGVKNLTRDLAKLEAAQNFAQILDAVHASVAHLQGLNELYIYDVALHVGAYKTMLPTRIYLHSGTRKGALALGLDARIRKALDMFELPEPLQVLAPHEVEDVLCIYKSVFSGGALPEDVNPPCLLPDDEVDCI